MKRAGIGALGATGVLIVAALFAQHNRSAVGFARAGGESFMVTNPGDAGPGSLREAILAADRLSSHAHIVIIAKTISIDAPLPALVNSHGILLEADNGAGSIDAARLVKGAVLQINSAACALRGLHIVNAHDLGVIVNAPGGQIDALTVANSKIGMLVGAAASGLTVRTSVFDTNDTGISVEPAVQDVSIASSIFRGNTRAGFWLVSAAEAVPVKPQTAASTSNPATAGRPVNVAMPANASSPADAAMPAAPNVRVLDAVFEQNAVGAVLANRPVSIRKSRFIGNRQAAMLVLGGGAQLEDNEIRTSVGTAISVVGASNVIVARNSFIDNAAAAIMARDSEVRIEQNKLLGNGSGIVSISGQDSKSSLVEDNVVTKSAGDAITVIGGSPRVERNQVTDNRGAGLRLLDLQTAGGGSKAAPRLEGNVFTGNAMNEPPAGVYRLAAAYPR